MAKHHKTMKCKFGEKEILLNKALVEIDNLNSEVDDLNVEVDDLKTNLEHKNKKIVKYKEKYKDMKELYDKILDKGVGNNYITNNDSSTHNTLVQLPGFSDNLLEYNTDELQALPFHNQKKVSHQVAKMVADHAKQDNGKQNLYCSDPNRLKFIFYDDDKWFEDMNRDKTVRDVCKRIIKKIGDPKDVISELGVLKRDMFLSEDHYGYSGPDDLMLIKHVLDYQQDVANTIYQIKACAENTLEDDVENAFAKDYLKKLAKLVRGDTDNRNEARKLLSSAKVK